MPLMYEVEHYTLGQGWINCWTTYDDHGNPEPTRFQTREEAADDLRQFLAECMVHFQNGDLQSPESQDNYRISAVHVAEQRDLFE
jgi:hypothetical protein